MSEFTAPYAGYDVLGKWDSPSWNDQTRAVMRARMDPPPRRFFTEPEWRCLLALCASALPQPERADPVPIAPWIDADLHESRGTGTRFATMPARGDAWRQGLAGLDAEARADGAEGFAGLGPEAREAVLSRLDDSEPAAPEAWKGLATQDFLRKTALSHIVAIYYVHPAGMSEIGFGGPASPRGYVRLGTDRADPWEAPPGHWPDRDPDRRDR